MAFVFAPGRKSTALPVEKAESRVNRRVRAQLRTQLQRKIKRCRLFLRFSETAASSTSRSQRSTANHRRCARPPTSAATKIKTSEFHKIFLYMLGLPVAVARSCSGGNATRYVLPVSVITSRFHVMEGISSNQRRRECFVQFASLLSPPASCCLMAGSVDLLLYFAELDVVILDCYLEVSK